MFHRRLTLLWGVMAAMALILAAQMTRLSVVQGAERRSVAERRLDLVDYLPTTRGRILDRKGRVLAEDRPCYDIAVEYEVITGAWAVQQAARRARSANRAGWAEMSPAHREAAVAAELPPAEARVEALWQAVVEHGGIDRAELDRRLDAIKKEVQSLAAVLWERQLHEEIKFDPTGEAAFRPRPIREQEQAHVLLPRVSDRVAFTFRRLKEELPGIRVLSSRRRVYPATTARVTLDRSGLPRPVRSPEPITVEVRGVADHLLGSMRDDIWASDVERLPFRDADGGVNLSGYRPGDDVGHRGLERSFEDHLRGARGVVHKRLDSGEEELDPRSAGRDLHLTLDIALQSRVQAIMSPPLGLAVVQQWQAGWGATGVGRPLKLPRGTPLDGAAVVLDVDSGDILALVSMPTLADAAALPDGCAADHRPHVNRPLEAVYPPGSIAKPLILAAAASGGRHRLDKPVECRGHYLPERRDVLRCWCYRAPHFTTHGSLRAAEALARSCNIYFYTLGGELGVNGISDCYRGFGVGTPLDVGLLHESRGESGGSVPTEQDMAALPIHERRVAAVIMGIGQGPVTWTPVHAANAFAMLARQGTVLDPTLVRGRTRSVASRENLVLEDDLVGVILDGLRASVAETYGTGHHIVYPDGVVDPIMNVPGVTVWAKTGTAQATPCTREHGDGVRLPCDLDCDGEPDLLEDPSHAWFVGLVGAGGDTARPRYAIAVVVEYGGSGGRTAGPIANEIIRALVTEGYLQPS